MLQNAMNQLLNVQKLSNFYFKKILIHKENFDYNPNYSINISGENPCLKRRTWNGQIRN